VVAWSVPSGEARRDKGPGVQIVERAREHNATSTDETSLVTFASIDDGEPVLGDSMGRCILWTSDTLAGPASYEALSMAGQENKGVTRTSIPEGSFHGRMLPFTEGGEVGERKCTSGVFSFSDGGVDSRVRLRPRPVEPSSTSPCASLFAARCAEVDGP
jgi:hypothetical protein